VFVEHSGDKAISYPHVSYWVRQFLMGRESFEDSIRRGRPPDFQTYFRIEGALQALPNASVREIARTTGIASSTVFYVFIPVFCLEFRNWRWVPHKLSDDQKGAKVQLAVSLQAQLERAQRRI
jgi:hypothetical protein